MRLRLPADGIAISLFAVASALLWRIRLMAPAPVELNIFGNSDQFDYFYPMHRLATARLLDGELPLWNPFQLAGTPLLATMQVGVFYPPNLLHLLLPTERAMQVLAFVHIALAGLCVYALVRTLGARPGAALIGALVFGWSTFVVGTHLWPPMTATLCWFALPLLGVALIARGRELVGCIATAAGLPLILLGGYIPYAVHGFQLAAGYALWTLLCALLAGERRAARGMLGWLAIGGALGLLLAAPQLLPTLELARQATRDTGGLTPQQLEPFGTLPLDTWRRLFTPGEHSNGHVAHAALLLLPAAFIARRHRAQAGFFLIVAVLSVILALGSATPLYELYLSLPGTRMFRGPGRILCLFVLAVAVLAALGADNLLGRELSAEPRRSATLIACLLLGSALIAAGVGFPPWSVVTASAAIAACLLLPARVAPLAAVPLGTLVLLNLASMPTNSEVQIWRPDALLRYATFHEDYRKLAAQLQLGRVLVKRNAVYQLVTSPHVVAMHGLHVFEDYDPLSVRRYADYASFLQHGELYDGRRRNRQYSGSLGPESIRHPRLLAAAGVMVTAEATGELGQPPRLQVTPVDNPLPRAYIVHGVRKGGGPSSTLAAIASGELQLNGEVVLESPPASALRPPGAAEIAEHVEFTRYRSEAVDLTARLQRPGALVLLDLDYPGWRATVNGKRARIYNANHLFRAVLLPAGKHKVSFRYAPASMSVGGTLGVLGLLGFAALCARTVYLRRRARRSAPAAEAALSAA